MDTCFNIFLYGFLGFVMAAGLLGMFMRALEEKRGQQLRVLGKPVLARIVEVEEHYRRALPGSTARVGGRDVSMLRQPMPFNVPANARVIYTFDSADDAEVEPYLSDLAERMLELEHREPTTPAEEEVARRMKIKLSCFNQRMLPEEFTGGRTVYEVAVALYKSALTGAEPGDDFVYLLAIPGGKGGAMMMGATPW